MFFVRTSTSTETFMAYEKYLLLTFITYVFIYARFF